METVGDEEMLRLIWDQLNLEKSRVPEQDVSVELQWRVWGISKQNAKSLSKLSHYANAKTAYTFVLLVHTFLFWKRN